MKKIFKYPLQPKPENVIEMPAGAAVLDLQTQNDVPCLWVEIDPDAPRIKRKFKIVPTGQAFEPGPFVHYMGTFQMQGGALVFHVYTDREEHKVDPS